jgi:hypothetical protein
MPLSELTERDAVLAAMREYDALGQHAFLAKYGYSPARRYQLVHEGKSYDSKAIAGVALNHQFPDRGPLAPSEFSGGEATVLPLLRNLSFEIRAMDQLAPAVTISANDVQLIRQSRARANYSDLSVDERNAYQRVHTNLEQLGSIVRERLVSTGSYTLKLTSGFNPSSGVRGYVPKDLWFALRFARLSSLASGTTASFFAIKPCIPNACASCPKLGPQ